MSSLLCYLQTFSKYVGQVKLCLSHFTERDCDDKVDSGQGIFRIAFVEMREISYWRSLLG
jgi:hypothetical protein